MHLPGDSIAQTLAILMAGYAVEGVGLAVEEKALLRIYREAAQTHLGGHFVHRLAVLHQTNHTGVQVGVLYAIPQVGSIQMEGSIFALTFCNQVTLGVQQLHRNGALAFHQRFHLNVGTVLFQGSGDLHAGVAKVTQCNMVLVHHQQAHIPVDAAVEGKVCFLGINAVVDAVVHPHRELVLCLQQLRDLCPEGGVAAVMGAELLTVQQHSSAGVDALKLQPDLLLCRVKGRSRKAGAIGAGTPPVIVAAVLTVLGVPGVGQCYGSGHAVRAGKLPVLHKLCNTAHSIPPVFRCIPVIFPCIFLSLLFYQSNRISQDARENRSFCVRIRFFASKCKPIYLYIFHKQMYPTRRKKKAAAGLPFSEILRRLPVS